MTYDEAMICLEHGFPVTVTKKMHDQEHLFGNNYFIFSLGSYLPPKKEKDGLVVSAGIGKEFRSTETVTLDAIEVANSFSNHAENYLRDGKIQQFKNLIEELMNAGLNQTQVTDRVKKIYKQLKGKNEKDI